MRSLSSECKVIIYFLLNYSNQNPVLNAINLLICFFISTAYSSEMLFIQSPFFEPL